MARDKVKGQKKSWNSRHGGQGCGQEHPGDSGRIDGVEKPRQKGAEIRENRADERGN